jgi:type III pantothenate kinase
MKAVIDAGNTRIKIGIYKNGTLVDAESFPTIPVENFYKHLSGKDFDAIILASVVEIPVHLISYLKLKTKHFIYLDHNTPLPLKNQYRSSQTLGVDRIALSVAAQDFHPGKNLLVIGTGSCITYDFINCEGEYIGGAISPGLQMRFKALNQFTARLPLLAPTENTELIGTDSASSIISGVVNGTALEIEGFIRSYKEKFNDLHCIISGGDSRYIAGKLKEEIEVIPDLNLYGLNKILDFNVKK